MPGKLKQLPNMVIHVDLKEDHCSIINSFILQPNVFCTTWWAWWRTRRWWSSSPSSCLPELSGDSSKLSYSGISHIPLPLRKMSKSLTVFRNDLAFLVQLKLKEGWILNRYLDDLGASHFLMGWTVAVGMITSLPFLVIFFQQFNIKSSVLMF